MKLINNLILGANMAVLSEGLALGEASGIPVEKQLEVLLAGDATSGVAQRKSGNVISGSYTAITTVFYAGVFAIGYYLLIKVNR
jgi:3-hydroxyisobutyrate dehydrogenase-like beta-hydroxyacid dehydrogenase